MDKARWREGTAGQMDGEAGQWTTIGQIGLSPLARIKEVGRQQQPLDIHHLDCQPSSPDVSLASASLIDFNNCCKQPVFPRRTLMVLQPLKRNTIRELQERILSLLVPPRNVQTHKIRPMMCAFCVQSTKRPVLTSSARPQRLATHSN